ncbi:Peptidoglycan-binding domain 1 protein (modular protein) [Bradyrhizobium sp. ORS 375]|uniref:peptidoglycan-binding domain-containing protein n=1 Tax=Bradyrhizobium sp. (strain ORS 375) TaxID=566679 RepID=UPI0002407573|nr:peptidoglycan-binding domain-containing protein [Bradyrhizobium sp. ORS 375]CCD96014.1 Peptidoglycan-binding domain 1 protein (modular protein) [Bradyrhizobium sp. ORS 375]
MKVNYRSLVPGGYFSANPFDRSTPVSIRCNNPGAVNGAAWERQYPGYVDTVETTPGNKTTIFEAPEFGVAVWWELLRRYSVSGADTVGKIITKYGGGQDYSNYLQFVTRKTGFSPRKKVPLDDIGVLSAFGKAMFQYEAGRPTPLLDEQIEYGLRLGRSKGDTSLAGDLPDIALAQVRTAISPPVPEILASPGKKQTISLDTIEGVRRLQTILIRCGQLDPPADGGYGPVTKWALKRFAGRAGITWDPAAAVPDELDQALRAAEPMPLKPGDDLAGRIAKAMISHGYWIARDPTCFNIVYIEGMDPDGSLNDNRNNVFNDLRVVFSVDEQGVPYIRKLWEATTEPSRKWTLTPMNPGGAFHIKFGQYKAWIKGWYHTHDALLQAGTIEGYRDPLKTFKRDFNYPVAGADFGVHQHWGYDLPHGDMGNSSAGCLVGRSTAGHREFMSIILKDPRYLANPTYRFMSAIIPAAEI